MTLPAPTRITGGSAGMHHGPSPDNRARHGSQQRRIAPQARYRAAAVGDGDQDDREPGTEEVSLGDFTDGDLVASGVSITAPFCNNQITYPFSPLPRRP